MTCVATQSDVIADITQKLDYLGNTISQSDKKSLKQIEKLWKKGVDEIEAGGLTQESCLRMSVLMISSENDAKVRVLDSGTMQDLNYYEGLKRIHDRMNLVAAAQGANEGQKPCCPFCPPEHDDC